jgi:hypothetical protein
MLGLGKTGAVRASATASSARSQDIYQRYAAALYRQALLALDDSAVAEHVVCDAIVNERALAAMPGRGEDDTRYRLAESVLRRCRQLIVGPVVRRGVAPP